MRLLLLFLTFLVTTLGVHAQTLSSQEQQLYELLIAHRAARGLPAIPLSRSLTYVAQLHVRDLADNRPDRSPCNAHSWSGANKWTACCYTPGHEQAACMWNKPRELTSYKGNGYEIACGSNECCSNFAMTPEYALGAWQKSPGHHAVILNEGSWSAMHWNAVGIGLYKGFAVIWFGQEADVH